MSSRLGYGSRARGKEIATGAFSSDERQLERMWLDHPERMQWWVDMEKSARGKTIKPEMGNFRADREDYATMARVMRDQGRLPFDLDEPSLPCHLASCGI